MPISVICFLDKKTISSKKKRKVTRQYIYFDADDSPLSTSVPSSSSSTSSDIYLGDNNNCNKTNIKKSLIATGKEIYSKSPKRIMDKEESGESNKLLRKLSIERSGTREKFSTKVPEILTPVNQIEVGKLTLISVKTDENYECLNNSHEILEIPSDISAVLTAVEDKNKEELRKKDEKITNLLEENGILQEQVKKYVSAIQMLKRDDSNNLSKVLEGLQLEDHHNYEEEAKLFEQKLIQVKK